MKSLRLGLIPLLVLPLVQLHGSPKELNPPNVLLITIDTLRADHLGCYGYKKIRTPNIDSLAAQGVRFAKAFSPVPITLPSHGSMLTGTYPMLNGLHDFSGNKLNPRQPTLASVLRQNGYATGAVVGAAVLDSRFGLNSGFEYYYDDFDFNRLLETNLDAMERPGNVVVDKALAWLRQNSRKPFFLWVHLYDPHHPYVPPAPYGQQYKDSPYDGEIAFVDAQVGRLLDYLKQSGLFSRTMVALAGDHGEGLGEHGEKTHGFFIYNSTLHVPLILKLPADRAPKPVAVETSVSLVDLMPTLLDAAGFPAPGDVQGRSLLPLLQGENENLTSDLYAESYLPRLHFNWSELRAIQVDKYRLIEAPRPELYDLERDPGETNNLFAQKKAVAAELQARLAAVIRKYSAGPELAEKTSLDPAMAERLSALGYAAVFGGGDPTISNRDLPDPKDRIETYELIAGGISDSQHARYQESNVKLLKALETEPNSVPVLYLLGINYYRQRQFPAAVRELEQVVKLSPDYALAVFYLGLAYGNSGRPDEAIAQLKRALELDPTNFSAAFNLGAVYWQKQMAEEGLAAFRQSVAIHPGYANGHRALGEILLYQGHVDEALASLQKAAELEPADRRIQAALARALEAKGLHQQAQEALRKAQGPEGPR